MNQPEALMFIHFLRHATLIVAMKNTTILVDPMLSRAEAMDPVAKAANQRRIPMVDLPITDEELQHMPAEIDAVLLTHHHRDHWDARAIELLPKSLTILCQSESEAAVRLAGFTSVTAVSDTHDFCGIRLHRTGGRHCTGEIRQKMGAVSSFILAADGDPTLYIAGDTVWCEEVEQALQTNRPNVVVVNAGAAQFMTGGPITMDADDVCRVCRALPSATVIAVHMEAINHCMLTREELRRRLAKDWKRKLKFRLTAG
jgi:L-ascorbate metabolism protein UlaG (beta-lactamase superfamily)